MFKSIKTAIAAAVAIVVSGTTASAGGLADQIMEAPVVVEDPVEVAPASSVPGWLIPVALLAVVIGIAAIGEDEAEEEGKGDEFPKKF